MSRVRVGVLASGGGTNLQALIDATQDPAFPAEIVVVLSDRRDAGALARAERAGIEARWLPRGGGRAAHEAAIVAALRAQAVAWVALAGYMRIVGDGLLDAFPGKVLNIHPSLLPAFPGLHAQRQALEHGVRVAGATVHLVDAGTDTGAILVQGAVPVLPEDDEATLAARILTVEHRIYPLALRWVTEGRLVGVEGRRAVWRLPEGAAPFVFGA
jgi:phosphoribosylglycinamide formyltransferase-1